MWTFRTPRTGSPVTVDVPWTHRPGAAGRTRHTFLALVVASALLTACNADDSGGSAGTAATTSPSPTTTNTIDIRAAYAHPEVLADVDWVVAHLQDPSVVVVDARFPMEGSLYAAGHIPGAVYVDMFQDICCPSAIMSADAFAHVMAEFGIGDGTTVVVYDTDGGLWATRLWWALRYYGHDEVKLLNGGLRQWIMAGQPLETTSPVVAPAVFTARVVDGWRATIDEVKQAITDPAVVLLDALPRTSYTGDLVLYGRGGHIPTALNLPYSDTVDGVSKEILDPATLARMLERLDLDPAQRVITYCGGGNAGSNLAFVLYLMGFDNVGLYDGSLGEWTQDSANPMETVP